MTDVRLLVGANEELTTILSNFRQNLYLTNHHVNNTKGFKKFSCLVKNQLKFIRKCKTSITLNFIDVKHSL